MASKDIKQLTRYAFDEVWNKGNLDVLDEIMHPDDIFHVAGWGDAKGPGEFREFVSSMRSAFPDIQVKIEDQIAEGDRVATRWTWRGTHRGEFLGIAPTGEKVMVSGITFGRVAENKRGETWIEGDTAGLMRQLGALPEEVGAQGRSR